MRKKSKIFFQAISITVMLVLLITTSNISLAKNDSNDKKLNHIDVYVNGSISVDTRINGVSQGVQTGIIKISNLSAIVVDKGVTKTYYNFSTQMQAGSAEWEFRKNVSRFSQSAEITIQGTMKCDELGIDTTFSKKFAGTDITVAIQECPAHSGCDFRITEDEVMNTITHNVVFKTEQGGKIDNGIEDITYTGIIDGAEFPSIPKTNAYENYVFDGWYDGDQKVVEFPSKVTQDYVFIAKWKRLETPIPEPTVVPTKEPTVEPTKEPTPEPTVEPTEVPTPEPTVEPTKVPTPEPTVEPTKVPTPKPTVEPTKVPTPKPTVEPTKVPTPKPTVEPTKVPTPKPTVVPTKVPTPKPTKVPTNVPTPEPTVVPTKMPTPEPTVAPAPILTPEPTVEPTKGPTPEPTIVPTKEPTPEPTVAPTKEPTPEPIITLDPGKVPDARPTLQPTPMVTVEPTLTPKPTKIPIQTKEPDETVKLDEDEIPISQPSVKPKNTVIPDKNKKQNKVDETAKNYVPKTGQNDIFEINMWVLAVTSVGILSILIICGKKKSER